MFVSNSQVIGCEDRLRNDLYCVRWGVKLCSTIIAVFCYQWTKSLPASLTDCKLPLSFVCGRGSAVCIVVFVGRMY